MSGVGSKAVIKNADMSEEMQADAIDCATQVRCTACRPAGLPALRYAPISMALLSLTRASAP